MLGRCAAVIVPKVAGNYAANYALALSPNARICMCEHVTKALLVFAVELSLLLFSSRCIHSVYRRSFHSVEETER